MHYMWGENMDMKLLEEKNDVFFNRKILLLEIKHDGQPTPSRKQVEELIAQQFNVDITHIDIDYIRTKAARNESKIKAYIYEKPIKEKETKGEESEAQTQQNQ